MADIEFGSTHSNKALKLEMGARSRYADLKTPPGLMDLINQVRKINEEMETNFSGEISELEADRILKEAKSKVPGSEEAYEIWDMWSNSYKQKK